MRKPSTRTIVRRRLSIVAMWAALATATYVGCGRADSSGPRDDDPAFFATLDGLHVTSEGIEETPTVSRKEPIEPGLVPRR